MPRKEHKGGAKHHAKKQHSGGGKTHASHHHHHYHIENQHGGDFLSDLGNAFDPNKNGVAQAFDPNRNGVAAAFDPNRNGVSNLVHTIGSNSTFQAINNGLKSAKVFSNGLKGIGSAASAVAPFTGEFQPALAVAGPLLGAAGGIAGALGYGHPHHKGMHPQHHHHHQRGGSSVRIIPVRPVRAVAY